MSSPPVISALPAVPATSDPNFETLAPALFSAIKNSFIGEVNAVASWINAGSWLTTPLAVSSGGTGASTFSSGKMLYGNGTGVLQAASGVSTDGTNLSTGGNLGVTGNASVTGNLAVDTNTFVVDAATNRVGIGTSSPLGKLDARSTSGAQIVASYDGSNYTAITTNSSGDCAIAPSGGDLATTGNMVIAQSSDKIGLGSVSGSFGGAFCLNSSTQNADYSTGVNCIPASDGNSMVTANAHPTLSGSSILFRGNKGGETNDILFFSQASATVTAGSGIALTAARMFIKSATGNVGIGGGYFTPLGKLDSRATSGNQIVASYDGSNYTGMVTTSAGIFYILPTSGIMYVEGDSSASNAVQCAISNTNANAYGAVSSYATAGAVRGYAGALKHGTAGDVLFTGETADALGIRAETKLEIGISSAIKIDLDSTTTRFRNANFRIDQTPAGTAGLATGTFLTINLNGTDYKIALLANA